ncbi:MAG TPA: hypothetical protein V6D08_17490 [Candidatus Obscuribacterales bacterium]
MFYKLAESGNCKIDCDPPITNDGKIVTTEQNRTQWEENDATRFSDVFADYRRKAEFIRQSAHNATLLPRSLLCWAYAPGYSLNHDSQDEVSEHVEGLGPLPILTSNLLVRDSILYRSVKPFFHGLSDIVAVYMEDPNHARLSIRAPEKIKIIRKLCRPAVQLFQSR